MPVQSVLPPARPQGDAYMPLHPPATDESPGLLKSDRYHLNPRLAATWGYDDNVTLSTLKPSGDHVFLISPGVTFIAGETTASGFGGADVSAPGLTLAAGTIGHAGRALTGSTPGISLDYNAGFNFYQRHPDLDSIDHVGRLNLIYPFSRTTLRLEQSYADVAQTSVDVASLLRSRSYVAVLDGTYNYSDVTSLQAAASLGTLNQERGVSTKTWSGSFFANYRWTPSTTVGIGFGGGLVESDQNATQYFEQARLRLAYEVSELIRADVSGGLEYRQLGKSAGNELSPVFDVGATYAPNYRTQLRLSGGQAVQSSAIQVGQNYTDSTVTFSVSHQVVYTLFSGLQLSYHHLSYNASAAGVQASRSDDYWSARLQLGMTFGSHMGVSTFIQRRENSSSQSTFRYTSNQVGLSVSWAY